MPHVVFVPLTGFRVREEKMRELAMKLPGLEQRAAAIAERPALGLLTLAGLTPESWTWSYHGTLAAERGLCRANPLGAAEFGRGFGPHGVGDGSLPLL